MLNKAIALGLFLGTATCGILTLPAQADMATVQQSTITTVVTGADNGVANSSNQTSRTDYRGVGNDNSSIGTVQISDTYTDVYGEYNTVINEQTQVSEQSINRSQRPENRRSRHQSIYVEQE